MYTCTPAHRLACAPKRATMVVRARLRTGWHYLSNATCLMRPRSSSVLFVVSRTTMTCYMIRHFCGKPTLDK